MKPRLRPAQAAWLAEIGLDLHWLDVPLAAPTVAPADAPRTGRSVPVPGQTAAGSGAGPEPMGRMPARPTPAAGRSSVSERPDQASRPASPAPAPASMQHADLATLAQAVQACLQCGRHQQRLRAVPGAGQAERPYYLIVAEQPGIDDEVAGQPFQGDSGRLLAAMLAAVHLPYADSRYGTYVMKCRALGAQAPDAAEIAACAPYLHREIALLRPRWILALGRVAAQAVLGGAGDLDALRGAVHPYRQDDGRQIPVWVTHQPASLLVRSSLKAEAWRDLVGLAQAVRAADPAAAPAES